MKRKFDISNYDKFFKLLYQHFGIVEDAIVFTDITLEQYQNLYDKKPEFKKKVNQVLAKIRQHILSNIDNPKNIGINPTVMKRLLDSELFRNTIFTLTEKTENKNISINKGTEIIIQ